MVKKAFFRTVGVASLLLLSLSGCKKEAPYVISGQMIDPNQSIYVGGVKVELWVQKVKSGVYEANFQQVDEQVTGSDGKFVFKPESASYAAIRLVFSRKGYFGWQVEVNTSSLTKEEGQYIQYQMIPQAWIAVHVVNSQPFDSGDYFDYRLMNAYTDCDQCCSENKYQFFGMEIDQTVNCMTAGAQDLVIQWSKRKNNEQILKTQSFYIQPFDTTRIDLEY
jgi:hypothetical protein